MVAGGRGEWAARAECYDTGDEHACWATVGVVVLLKSYDSHGFVFFTNYESRKGHELADNPQAALVFWWGELERQVRIEGLVSKVSAAESDAYYNSRPLGAAGWAPGCRHRAT